ncbi:Protocadherin-10 [Dissostichus eleginoides]|uniref:Protocadherin-10 n=1 Tax=Dissostichus eleginoides TaxID=100907 RepID=A0AAD9BLT6_DISEL|nr:Protocadherin-10 [Dissostichus eleginoides]
MIWLILILSILHGAVSQLHYSVPEEQEPGSVVGNIAEDLGLDITKLSARRFQTMGMFRMDWRTGELRTARRISPKRDPQGYYDLLIEVRDHGQPPLSSSASVSVMLVDSVVEGRSGDRGSASKAKETSLDLTLILIIALGSVSFIFLLAMIVLAVRCQKDKKLDLYTCLLAGECCMCCGSCCSRQARGRKQKKLSKSDIMLVQSTNVTSGVGPVGQVPVEESGVGGVGGGFGSHHQNQNSYCYQVCLTPESAKTDLMFLKPCSPSRSTDTDHTNPCGAIVTGYSDQQPDIISNGSILSNETKHQRAELSYLVDRPRRVNSSAFQEADIVSSKDSGHGDSEQGDSDHDATNRGHSAGEREASLTDVSLSSSDPKLLVWALILPFRRADLFSNCTEECKALGHSDRCWMPSFVPSDGRQGPDYRSNLHVPGMDATLPDTEVPSSVNLPDQLTMTSSTASSNDRSFSTFGKDGQRSQSHQSLHHHLHQQQPQYSSSTLERKEYDRGTLPYKPTFLCEYQYENSLGPYDFGLVQNRY